MLISTPQNLAMQWDKGVRLTVGAYLYPNIDRIPDDVPYDGPHPHLMRDNTTKLYYSSAAGLPWEYWGEPISGDKPLTVQIVIHGMTTPTVEIHNDALPHIPGAMEAINEWVARHNFMGAWSEEVTKYREVMDSVDLPTMHLVEGRDYADFTTTIYPEDWCGHTPTLELIVRVCKTYTPWVRWELPTGEYCDGVQLMCQLCDYHLDYPITIDKVKDSLRPVLQGYLDALG